VQLQNVLYFLLWAGVFFVMMRFGCGAHIMGHGHHHNDEADQDQASGSGSRFLPPEKATDPVCGLTVETAVAKSAAYQGHIYYFCSQNCREKFEAAPASYVKPAMARSHEKEHHHGRY